MLLYAEWERISLYVLGMSAASLPLVFQTPWYKDIVCFATRASVFQKQNIIFIYTTRASGFTCAYLITCAVPISSIFYMRGLWLFLEFAHRNSFSEQGESSGFCIPRDFMHEMGRTVTLACVKALLWSAVQTLENWGTIKCLQRCCYLLHGQDCKEHHTSKIWRRSGQIWLLTWI